MRIPKTLVLKAIREMCMECVAHQYKEVELCPAKNCPLWLYRFGAASLKRVPELAAKIETLPKFDASKAFAPLDPIEQAIRQSKHG
jgi:hypothetical protein